MRAKGIIEIKSGVKTERVINGRNGTFKVYEQDAYVTVGDEVRKIKLNLDESQVAYPAGKFACDTALTVGQYGDLMVPRSLTLTPIKAGA